MHGGGMHGGTQGGDEAGKRRGQRAQHAQQPEHERQYKRQRSSTSASALHLLGPGVDAALGSACGAGEPSLAPYHPSLYLPHNEEVGGFSNLPEGAPRMDPGICEAATAAGLCEGGCDGSLATSQGLEGGAVCCAAAPGTCPGVPACSACSVREENDELQAFVSLLRET